MSLSSSSPSLERVVVRTYRREDQAAVARLYTEGLLAGQLSPNDTGADVESVQDAYLADPMNHFWVAELDGRVVGMIGVARDEGAKAEIRRLRVDKSLPQAAVGTRLLLTAMAHCKRQGYLKVVLDTRFEGDAAKDLFERCGFHHTRTRSMPSKDLLEFYVDLYRQPQDDQDDGACS